MARNMKRPMPSQANAKGANRKIPTLPGQASARARAVVGTGGKAAGSNAPTQAQRASKRMNMAKRAPMTTQMKQRQRMKGKGGTLPTAGTMARPRGK